MSKKVSLLFSKRAIIGSWLIRVFTWSQFSHVEIVTDDATLIGANIPEGVEEIDIQHRLNLCSEAWMVDIPCEQADVVVAWARAQVGKKYDYVGLMNFLIHTDVSDNDKWFCSELVSGAFEAAGTPLFRTGTTHRITPQQVWMLPYEAKQIK